jgi:thioredoxin
MIAMNEELFNKMAQEGAEPVLVEFWAPWCVYCRRIAPAMLQVAQAFEGRLAIAQINIDDEPALADREHIEVVPTFVLYRGGKALGSIVAPDSKARIESFIREHLDI